MKLGPNRKAAGAAVMVVAAAAEAVTAAVVADAIKGSCLIFLNHLPSRTTPGGYFLGENVCLCECVFMTGNQSAQLCAVSRNSWSVVDFRKSCANGSIMKSRANYADAPNYASKARFAKPRFESYPDSDFLWYEFLTCLLNPAFSSDDPAIGTK